MESEQLPHALIDALAPFCTRRNFRPVSLSALVKAARYAMPDLPFTDRRLGNLLARALIERGCSIHFDGTDRPEPKFPIFH